MTLLEKNATVGGRARVLREQGFSFDMGPSWYWMPDVFESFFNHFGKSAADYYQLQRLDPAFQVIYGPSDVIRVPADIEGIYGLFEGIEKGSAAKLKKFLEESRYKYDIGMRRLVYTPCFSWLEFARRDVIGNMFRLHLFRPLSTYVRSFFKDPRLVSLMEFPVLFLGAMAQQIPALYSLMNYAAFSLGTWYPRGGMGEITRAMQSLAGSLGVDVQTGCEAEKIVVSNRLVTGIETNKGLFKTDGLIASGDYHHMEQRLLEEPFRNYDEAYWKNRTLAPSCLLFYLGINKPLAKLAHHNLFFDASFEQHARDIYTDPRWPEDPLFYVCCPSKTDESVAPPGMENLFVLIPVAPALPDGGDIREVYFDKIMQRLEQFCGEAIRPAIVYRKSYGISNFEQDYHAYKGNAYGLANTLRQTAVLKPSLRNRKVGNLFYAGQLTVPGPGMPPAIISGRLAASQLMKYLNAQTMTS